MDIFISSLVTFVFTITFTKAIIPFLKNFFLDVPNNRSSHKNATPSGGGIGFIISSIVIGIRFSIFLPLISLPLALVGFIDDLKYVSPLKRIIAQIFTLLVIYLFSPFKNILDTLPFHSFLLTSLIIFIGVYLINIFNFIDGLDGLLAGCMSIILLYYSININMQFFPIFAALIGFQFLNWAPAKVFMGDGGSTFLGAIYFGLIMNSDSYEQVLNLLILSMPLLFDTTYIIIRRLLAGQNIFKPHKLHLFQRLHQAGLKHSVVSTIYIISIFLLAISLTLKGFQLSLIVLFLEILFALYLNKKVAVPLIINQI